MKLDLRERSKGRYTVTLRYPNRDETEREHAMSDIPRRWFQPFSDIDLGSPGDRIDIGRFEYPEEDEFIDPETKWLNQEAYNDACLERHEAARSEAEKWLKAQGYPDQEVFVSEVVPGDVIWHR